MNKKTLVLIAVIIVLGLIIATLSFMLYQSTTSNENEKADSLELQIKDMIASYVAPSGVSAPNFSIIDNATAIAQFTASYSGNLTKVSETSFLNDLNGYMPNSAVPVGYYESSSIIRSGNTFYLVRMYDNCNVSPYQITTTCVSYTP